MTNVVLCGLSPLESAEFHLLDAGMPFGGVPVWPGINMPESAAETRWLELWRKHLAALARTGTTASACRAAVQEA